MVNSRGAMHGSAAVLPHLRDRHSGSKYALRAISEGLRQELRGEVRSTVILPGLTRTELPSHITDPNAAEHMNKMFEIAINADAIARSIKYAIEQPDDVDVNAIVVRPAKQAC